MKPIATRSLLLAVGLGLALAGCGGGSTSTSTVAKRSVAAERQAEAAAKAEAEAVANIPGGPDPQATFYLAKVPSVGLVLVDSAYKTLYRFGRDVRGSGKTHCYGACTKIWYPKASYRRPLGESSAFDPAHFGTIMRKDGYRQATYDGWPLYTNIREYSREAKAAGTKSFGGTWYALHANGQSVGR